MAALPRDMTALLWYQRDLRVHDHPALVSALEAHARVVPVFCLDDRLLHGRHRSGPRTQFLLECLADLRASLRARGSDLVVRRGPPEAELTSLARTLDAGAVHCSADVTPFARARVKRVGGALATRGVEVHAHPGTSVIDDVASPRTQAGGPYTVFSPFHRTWERCERRPVLGAPPRMPALPAGLACGRIPALASLGLRQEVASPPDGGEGSGRVRLERFLAEDIAEYASNHDALGADRTSRLSPYLHLGCVSARETEARLPPGDGPAAFRRQLCWRDFHHHVLAHFPQNAHLEFQARYRQTIPWRQDEDSFRAWCDGRTGYPLVDAGMRQLRREGWMHNRARLVAGSFLTKDLGIDWRRGEAHFMRLLVDGDEANNNGNWQWIASVGTDPQPVARRLYNPARQMAAHDPDGTYVRRHLPELADVPARYLSEPWTMPAEVQRACGCLVGRDYPAPVVDHAEARREALERYRV